MLKSYYDYITDVFDWTRDWGYFASITGNHDHLRFNTGARNDPSQLKVMMTWIMTMPLPILYYGDEIGLRSLADLPNVEGANHNGKERAGGRSPMQWNSEPNAGFSTCAPENIYIPVCPEWTPATSYPLYLEWKAAGSKNPTAPGAITVESQEGDPQSLLNWTRALIKLRKENKAFWASSRFEPVFDESRPYPMLFLRTDGLDTYLIALNPTSKKQKATLDLSSQAPSTVLNSGKFSCKTGRKGLQINMGPVSAAVVKL